MIELRHLYVLIFISGQVFPCKAACSSKEEESLPLKLYRSWEARPKEWPGPWICSLPQSYISSRLVQGHIVILILDLFSATGSGITHLSLSELDLFGKCSQSLSLFQDISNFRYKFWQLYHVVWGLNINIFINYAFHLPKSFLWLVFFIMISNRQRQIM